MTQAAARTTSRQTVRGCWESRVDAGPDVPFLISDDDVRLTYGEMDRSVNSIAHGLQAEGVGAGDRVALLLPNGPALLRIQLALQKLGAVMVPMISGSSHAEIHYVLNHCRPTHVVAGADAWSAVARGGGIDVQHDLRAYVDGGADGAADTAVFETGRDDRPEDPGIAPLDPMSIMYTSGSTGRPKGVVQPSIGFLSAGRAIAARLGATADDNFFSALPLFHTAATHMLLAPAIACGARFTLVSAFSRGRFWDQVRASGGTVALLMPAQLSILMTAEPRPDDRDHPLRVISSHIRPDAFVERFGVDVCTTWSMTETSGIGTLSAPGTTDYRPKMIGTAMSDEAEVKVVGLDGRPVPPGELGEFCFRHPHVMTGYFEDEANTAAALEDGWVRTGDLCALDEEGRVYFHGRLKHVIKRAGENIAGEEVEFTLMAHPAVEECVVCGVEDPIYTEEVHASVVVREGMQLTPEELTTWCAERLSAFKVPRYVTCRSSAFPRLANGKTNRRAVNEAVDVAFAWDRRSERAAS
ncbi:MAG: carnitine-CoA ligase [Baekduia sp.]|jgi:crotonobetaine/carnitine-CoA ligase|nr:carnitine-CoA ligase [Baekduia sp.]